MKDTQIIQIPFDGFYYSITMSYIESEAESEQEYRESEGLPMFTDWQVKSFQDVAKEYTENYKDYLEKEYGLELQSLAFESLSMPREYNFTTDRIFCHISQNDILELYTWNRTTGRLNQELINNTFKSRDGFISFYGDFVDNWEELPLDEWDHNQLAILLPEPESYYDLWEDSLCNGFFYDQINFIEADHD